MERARREELRGLPGALLDAPLEEGARVELPAEVAHHMRVRRIAVGAAIRLTDGAGTQARAEITDLHRRGAVALLQSVLHDPPPPRVRLLVPVGDRDRMLWLAEKATELSLARWTPVRWSRSRNVSPRGEGEAFLARVRARMASALVQSGGSWLPEVDGEVDGPEAPGHLHESESSRLVLDPSGEPILRELGLARAAGEAAHSGGAGCAAAAGTVIALGPEGGLTDDERALLAGAGFRACALGARVLRFETAAVAALATLLAHMASEGGEPGTMGEARGA